MRRKRRREGRREDRKALYKGQARALVVALAPREDTPKQPNRPRPSQGVEMCGVIIEI
jgi:hypothetical protein